MRHGASEVSSERAVQACHFDFYLFGNHDSWTDIHFKLRLHRVPCNLDLAQQQQQQKISSVKEMQPSHPEMAMRESAGTSAPHT